MGAASSDLLRLRPVTFRYKQAAVAGERTREYGLIAEEVAEVYPDLVVHSATGEVETVQYHKLVPMLLNELQKQQRELGKQEEEITQLKARLAALEKLLPAKESLAQW
jgi:flagellar motility protein MotE (MotC chaperone)